jgi:hypothetical protein
LNINGANLVMFVDKINALITDSYVGALQNDADYVLTELKSSFNRKTLVINIGKTVVMSFHIR